MEKPNYYLRFTNYLLPILIFSTIFERLNIFIPALDFSLKISLIILPIAGLGLFIKKRLVFNPTFLFPALAAVLGAELLSVFFSYNPFQSFQVVVFHLLMMGLFYLIVWSIRDERGLDRLVWAWGAGAAAVSLLGIWQFARYAGGGDPTLSFDRWFAAKNLPVGAFVQTFYEWLNLAFLRPSSTFIDVSTGASFTGIFLLFGLGWFISWDRNDRRRLLLAVPLILSSLYFLMAISRSAAVGLLAGAAVFACLNLRDRVNAGLLKRRLWITLGSLLGLGLFLSLWSAERWASTLARLKYLRAAGEMLKHNPLLGVGAGNFEPYYVNVIDPGAPAGYSHSIFLTWLGETGILGLAANIFLAAALIYFLYRIFDRLKRENVWKWRIAGLLSAYVALIFANLFHAHYGLEFTWVLIGLVVSGYYSAKSNNYQLSINKLDTLGVKVDNVTMEEAVERIKIFFKTGRKAYVVTPNPEMVIASRKDKELTRILNKADLAVPDGAGIVWASRIWGTPLKERVAGTDLFIRLCEEASRRGGRVLLLEGPEGLKSAPLASGILRRRYPKLEVYVLVIGPDEEERAVSAILNVSRGREIDFLFIAYGHGRQERWIARNLSKIPVKMAMGVGGAFDFIAGAQRRAPVLIRRLGFEWLYRLVNRQPNQSWRIKRQLALIPFIFLTFREAFRR